MIDVVVVYAPRPNHAKWMDYLPLLRLQQKTAHHFGHRHVVVTDAEDLPGFSTVKVKLPDNLMRAILAGQVAYLEQWTGENPVVLADADCLVTRHLSTAFDGSFHIGLTNRGGNAVAPINNGAMYIAAGCKRKALRFFRRALALCEGHWGGDQEAIAKAAAPVPDFHGVQQRDNIRIGFFSMRTHNCAPKERGWMHRSPVPYIVHFKGDRKDWMEEYAQRFIVAGAS